MAQITKEELNAVPEGTTYTSEVVTCNENGQGSWLGNTELGHRVYLNAPRSPGEALEYVVKTSQKTGNNYCVPTNPAPRQPGSSYNNNNKRGTGGASNYKHDLPPIAPADCVNVLRMIVANYAYAAEGKEKSLSAVLEEELGFGPANHQALISGMLIACTKPNKYYEARS